MKIVIAGNGILALSTAFRVVPRLKSGDELVIIGRAARPGSATLAAAAMLNSFAEIDVGGLEHEIDFYHFELSHLAGRMWPKFAVDVLKAGGAHLPPGCQRCEGLTGGCFDRGTYVVNNTAADSLDDENFDAIVAALEQFDEPFQHVSPRDIPNYIPEQRHRATRAIYIPNEGWLNPRLVLESLDACVAIHPATKFVEGAVQKLVKRGDRVEAALLDDGTAVTGDVFLLATGASVGDVLHESDLGVQMQRVYYGVGVSLEILSIDNPHEKCIRTPNRGLACGIYSAPYFLGPNEPRNHILVGASNYISPKPSDFGKLTSVESLSRAAIEQINFNWHRAELVRVNVGWRPTSQDTFPLVGRTSIPNLIVATGTKRDGFHLSPILSEYLTAMIYGEPVDPRFEVFAPERKLIHTMTREQAIEKATRHQVSAAYQHGFSPSKSRMPEQISEMYRTSLERLHDQVGATDWGIPPEMIEIYRNGHARADGTRPR